MSESDGRVDSICPPIRDSFQPDGEGASDYCCMEDVEQDMSWTDRAGNVYFFRSNPLFEVCPMVLSQEMCERLAFYGLMPTLKHFLKKTLSLDDAGASSHIGIFSGLIMLFPIISAAIADTWLGTYKTILVFSAVYGSGLALMDVAAIESISSPWMVYLGLFVLITIGSGGIKSCVNVFGAQQMHPEHHKEQVEKFYMYFYAAINVGSIIGGLAVPQVAESVSYFAAYLIPISFFVVATIVFVAGTKRYVKVKPQGSAVVGVVKVVLSASRYCSFARTKKSHGGNFDDVFVEDVMKLLKLLPVCAMTVPLNVAYNQMTTAFLTQSEKMDASIFGTKFAPELMQTVDPVAVIVSSLIVERLIFPKLQKIDMMPNAMVRFAIGNIIAVLALLCAFGVELGVMHQSEPNTMSIWWQVPQFSFIALAEIFVISTSYEVSFSLAPTQLKTVASACNLLFFSFAGFLSSLLFLIFAPWMPNYEKDKPATYQHSQYDHYYLVLASVCLLGAFGCMMMRPYFRKITTERRHLPAEPKDSLLDDMSSDSATSYGEIVE